MRRGALFLVLIAALSVEVTSCGGSGSPPPVTVNVTDNTSTVAANGFVLFSATVQNSSNQTVTWTVLGGASNGTINASSGLYTAPAIVPNPPTITVTATPQADASVMGQATVTITIGITVSPADASVQALATEPFTATVEGSTNQAVNWEVDNIPGGNAAVGTISAGGVYQAPESVPVDAASGATMTVTIQAVPQVNTSFSASATVTVTSANQLGQNLPVNLGTSGGNINNVDSRECASGTLGSLVVRAGIQYILSNNHILADSDAGSIGDGITQPGLIDVPNPCVASSGSNTVAHLSQFINIEQTNPPADAAIAQVVTSPASVSSAGTIIELGDSLNGSGVPSDEAPASTILPVSSLVPNTTAVAKSGRSTGLTCATVEATNIDVSVQYTRGLTGGSFTARYINQVAVNGGEFSAAGDSGSLIVSQAGAQPVALLYAGSSTDTVGAPVATVLANLGDRSNPQNFPTFVGPATRNAVAGCTSSGSDASDATAQTAPQPSAAELSKAEAARSENASALMSDPAVLAVGVDGSLDRTGHAAVVLFIRKGQPLVRAIPHNIGEVPTRVVAVNSLPQTGVLDQQATAQFEKNAGQPSPANPTLQQLAAAKVVKDKYSASLMNQPGILGVGVTSSLDNPSEAAILVFVEKGQRHNPIPLELDGVRVRVKSTDKFRAFRWGRPKPRR